MLSRPNPALRYWPKSPQAAKACHPAGERMEVRCVFPVRIVFPSTPGLTSHGGARCAVAPAASSSPSPRSPPRLRGRSRLSYSPRNRPTPAKALFPQRSLWTCSPPTPQRFPPPRRRRQRPKPTKPSPYLPLTPPPCPPPGSVVGKVGGWRVPEGGPRQALIPRSFVSTATTCTRCSSMPATITSTRGWSSSWGWGSFPSRRSVPRCCASC